MDFSDIITGAMVFLIVWFIASFIYIKIGGIKKNKKEKGDGK